MGGRGIEDVERSTATQGIGVNWRWATFHLTTTLFLPLHRWALLLRQSSSLEMTVCAITGFILTLGRTVLRPSPETYRRRKARAEARSVRFIPVIQSRCSLLGCPTVNKASGFEYVWPG